MLRMPPVDDPIRKLYNEADIPESIDDRIKLPRVPDALTDAKKTFEDTPTLKSVNVITRKPNGDIALIKFKRTGTVIQLWNFGQ